MSDPDAIRAQIEDTRQHLSFDVDALADKVSPSQIAERQKEKVRDRITGVKESVMGGVRSAGDSLRSAADGSGDTASAAKDTATGHPIVIGLLAFGVGWLLSSLIPTTDTEQQLAQTAKEKAAPVTDRLKDVAKDAGHDVAQNLKGPAQHAAQSVKSSATDAVGAVQDEGRSAVADVKDQAAGSAGAVRDRAAAAKDDLQSRASGS